MNWEEAIKYCEEHECEECIAKEKATNFERNDDIPCCMVLVSECWEKQNERTI